MFSERLCVPTSSTVLLASSTPLRCRCNHQHQRCHCTSLLPWQDFGDYCEHNETCTRCHSASSVLWQDIGEGANHSLRAFRTLVTKPRVDLLARGLWGHIIMGVRIFWVVPYLFNY